MIYAKIYLESNGDLVLDSVKRTSRDSWMYVKRK